MVGCYILHSNKLNKFYIGVTQDDIVSRIKKHNDSSYGNHRFTAKATDWELFLFIDCLDYSQALRIERKIKSMKSSVYIRNLVAYPELVEKLVLNTQQST
jgi:putative endonuclease